MFRKFIIAVAFAAMSMTISTPAFAGGTDLDAVWHNGLQFKSADKSFKIKVGGRIMNDWAWLSADDALKDSDTSWDSGTEFRRARFFIAGHIYDNVKFKAQYDFAGGKPHFKDVYIALTKLPVIGSVKVGHFKQPFSLEELTSSKYISLMERALPVEAFAPSRQTGIMIGNKFADGAGTWAVSTFRLTDVSGKDYGNNDMNFAGRITFAPVKTDDTVIHLGAAYTSISPTGDSARFRARPEIHLAPARIANTGKFGADGVNTYGLEAAAKFGSLSIQGEYMSSTASATEGDNPTFSGYYAYVSYFLTGESRPYKKGTFHRVKPLNNYGEGGSGAVEVIARVSSLDLTDASIDGGEVDNYTVGLNWYLNPNTRVMANYISSDKSGVGTAQGTTVRFQVDF